MARDEGNDQFDAVIVGAGFAGMYMLHRLRQAGFSARVFEAGSDVGGTWYWNRYPGARCDVESLQYQYSFSDALQQEWNWSERYATQPEILSYCQHVAERFDLRRDMQFETRVTAARYDESADRWMVETDRGDRVSAQFCIMATGCLSLPKYPEIAGRESFQGASYHTGLWPHEGVDFSGQRVAVIGTGSSGIQAIPKIAEQASSVTVFQRTPNFSIPANQEPLSPEYVREYKDQFPALREQAKRTGFGFTEDPEERAALDVTAAERERYYEEGWEAGGFNFLFAFNDLLFNEEANDTAAEFVRNKIQETVTDTATAERLSPRSYPIATKRICVDSNYYETYNRENVRLVDISEAPIETITAAGLRTATEEFAFDSIVFATGFDAMTGALLAVDFRGRGGVSLADSWAEGPRTYLGLSVSGFPNLFMITGPGSPSVLSNMLVSIEQHVDWIGDCLVDLRAHELGSIEATVKAQDAWVVHVNEVANSSLFPRADSWYVGANVPGKPRVFTPYIGVGSYKEKCDAVASNGYEGFRLAPRGVAAGG